MLLRKLKICIDYNMIKRPMPVGSFKFFFSRDCLAKNNLLTSQAILLVISILISPLIAERATVSAEDITGIV
jgi:hypothetical protein